MKKKLVIEPYFVLLAKISYELQSLTSYLTGGSSRKQRKIN